MHNSGNPNIIGKNSRMFEAYKAIGKAVNNKASVLIQGETGWVQTKAAKLLGMSRRIIKYKMQKYGIERE